MKLCALLFAASLPAAALAQKHVVGTAGLGGGHGLDAKAGEVATDGWLVGSVRSVLDVARSFADAGVDAFLIDVNL